MGSIFGSVEQLPGLATFSGAFAGGGVRSCIGRLSLCRLGVREALMLAPEHQLPVIVVRIGRPDFLDMGAGSDRYIHELARFRERFSRAPARHRRLADVK